MAIICCKDEHIAELISVENEETPITNRNTQSGTPSIAVVNGRIVFENEGHFNAVNSYLADLTNPKYYDIENVVTSNEILTEWESKIGFQSYRSDFILNTSADPKYFDQDSNSRALASYELEASFKFWSRCSGYTDYNTGYRNQNPSLGYCVSPTVVITTIPKKIQG